MERGLVVRTTSKGAEVDIRRAVVGHGRNAHLAEEMHPVGRDGQADLLQVVRPEAYQLLVAEMFDGGKGLGLVFCVRGVSKVPSLGVESERGGRERKVAN